MGELYPLKFKPLFFEKIWGGSKISTHLNLPVKNISGCGEAWVLSAIEKKESMVRNGFLKNNALNEIIEIYNTDLIGERVYEKFGLDFPLLFKFINAEDYLSVQVHPDNETAIQRQGTFGKSELWYVIHADEGAKLISGFKKPVSQDEYQKHLKNNSLVDILNFESVSRGDVFYIPAGHIHAIGPGILLAEIQQSSDITYRVYDWDRFDAAGIKRELHTQLALDVIDFDSAGSNKINLQIVRNKAVSIIKNDFFNISLLQCDKNLERDSSSLDSFIVQLCVEGSYRIVTEHEPVDVIKGESVLIPADIENFQIIPNDNCTIIETHL